MARAFVIGTLAYRVGLDGNAKSDLRRQLQQLERDLKLNISVNTRGAEAELRQTTQAVRGEAERLSAAINNQIATIRNLYQANKLGAGEATQQLAVLKQRALEFAQSAQQFGGSTREIRAFAQAARTAEATMAGIRGEISKLGLSSQVLLALRQNATLLGQGFGAAGQTLGIVAGQISGLGPIVSGLASPLGIVGGSVAGLTTALGTLVARGRPLLNDLERSFNILRASGERDIGGIAERIQELQQQLGNVGESFNRAQLAQTIAETVKAGASASDAFQILASSAQLAAAEQTNLTETTGLLLTNLRQFGLAASDAAEFGDKLATAANLAAGTAADLSQGFNVVGATARSQNLTLADTLALLVDLDNKGLKASEEGARGLRGVLAALSKPTADLQRALRDLGVEFTDANGQFRQAGPLLLEIIQRFQGNEDAARRLSTGFDVFARNAFLALVQAPGQGQISLAQLRQEIQNSEGALKRYADTLATGGKKSADSLKNALDDLSITIAGLFDTSALNSKLASWVRAIDNAIQRVRKSFEDAGLKGLLAQGLSFTGPVTIPVQLQPSGPPGRFTMERVDQLRNQISPPAPLPAFTPPAAAPSSSGLTPAQIQQRQNAELRQALIEARRLVIAEEKATGAERLKIAQEINKFLASGNRELRREAVQIARDELRERERLAEEAQRRQQQAAERATRERRQAAEQAARTEQQRIATIASQREREETDALRRTISQRTAAQLDALRKQLELEHKNARTADARRIAYERLNIVLDELARRQNSANASAQALAQNGAVLRAGAVVAQGLSPGFADFGRFVTPGTPQDFQRFSQAQLPVLSPVEVEKLIDSLLDDILSLDEKYGDEIGQAGANLAAEFWRGFFVAGAETLTPEQQQALIDQITDDILAADSALGDTVGQSGEALANEFWRGYAQAETGATLAQQAEEQAALINRLTLEAVEDAQADLELDRLRLDEILAGGLTPQNVDQAVALAERLANSGLDVSSAFEAIAAASADVAAAENENVDNLAAIQVGFESASDRVAEYSVETQRLRNEEELNNQQREKIIRLTQEAVEETQAQLEVERELAQARQKQLQDLTQFVDATANAVRGVFDAFNAQTFSQFANSISSGVALVANTLAPGSGPLAQTVLGFIGWAVDGLLSVFDNGFAEVERRISQRVKTLQFATRAIFDGAVETYTESYLFGIIRVTKQRLNEERADLIQSVAQGVSGQLANAIGKGFKDALETGDFSAFRAALNAGLADTVTSALIDSLLRSKLLEGVLDNVIVALTNDIEGDEEEAFRELQRRLDSLSPVFENLYDRLLKIREQFGITPTRPETQQPAAPTPAAPEPTTPTLRVGLGPVFAVPDWWSRPPQWLDTFGAYINRLVEQGIRIRIESTGGLATVLNARG